MITFNEACKTANEAYNNVELNSALNIGNAWIFDGGYFRRI